MIQEGSSMQPKQSIPTSTITVTHAGSDYTLEGNITVRRVLNGFDTATVVVADTESINYSDRVASGDAIVIKEADNGDALVTIFNGIVRNVDPLLSRTGSFLKIECDGSGWGLAEMLVAEEYGSESAHTTPADFDTIKEIIEDATNGIIPEYVNDILNTGVSSGHNYTTQVETIAGTIPYIYFPYKPASKAINDLCDIVQAIKGANAGVHWRVDTSNRFLLATVANHAAPASTYWSTWWRTDADGSTLTEGEDFTEFAFRDAQKESNYILYHGRLRLPATGDLWTENNSAEWTTDTARVTLSDDNTVFKVGAYSIKASTVNNGGTEVIMFPSGSDLGIDATKMGGEYNIPTYSFYARKNVEFTAVEAWIYSTAGTAYRDLTLIDDQWAGFNFTIGDYQTNTGSTDEWFSAAAMDWSDIDGIAFKLTFAANNNNKYFWVDGIGFNGWVLRGARQNAAYSATDTCRMKVINDNVAKHDTLSADDDSGLIGRLAYAEYLRASSTPIVGSFQISIVNDLVPGQLVRIRAKKKSDGSYHVNENFRVLRLIHDISDSATTTLEVTNDLLNGNPRLVPNRVNALFEAVKPEFQNRQVSSVKMREIDITQPILEKSY
jgi:hypothetical protein